MRKINKSQGLMRFVYILESTFHSDPVKLLFGYQATYHHSGLIFPFVCKTSVAKN